MGKINQLIIEILVEIHQKEKEKNILIEERDKYSKYWLEAINANDILKEEIKELKTQKNEKD